MILALQKLKGRYMLDTSACNKQVWFIQLQEHPKVQAKPVDYRCCWLNKVKTGIPPNACEVSLFLIGHPTVQTLYQMGLRLLCKQTIKRSSGFWTWPIGRGYRQNDSYDYQSLISKLFIGWASIIEQFICYHDRLRLVLTNICLRTTYQY